MHNPFGKTGGGSLASHAYLNAFCQITTGQIDLICSDNLKKNLLLYDKREKINNVYFAPERSFIQKIGSIFTGKLNRYIDFTKKIAQKNFYDFVVFDHNCIAGPLLLFFQSKKSKTITIHHNYEFEYYRDNANTLSRFLFLHQVRKNEKKAYCNSDLNLFLTEADLKTFKRVYGTSNGQDYVLGTFEYGPYSIFQRRIHPLSTQKILSITGTLCNKQTKDGLLYFFEKLYSYVPLECKIIVSGRNPSNDIVDLCKSFSNVDLIKNPEDMNVVIQSSSIYICPTKIGGGLKLRVMDGLRNGIPVLCHEKAARGFDCFFNRSYFKIFHDEIDFSRCLNELMSLIDNGTVNCTEIQKDYLNNFSFESGCLRLKQILNKVFNSVDSWH